MRRDLAKVEDAKSIPAVMETLDAIISWEKRNDRKNPDDKFEDLVTRLAINSYVASLRLKKQNPSSTSFDNILAAVNNKKHGHIVDLLNSLYQRLGSDKAFECFRQILNNNLYRNQEYAESLSFIEKASDDQNLQTNIALLNSLVLKNRSNFSILAKNQIIKQIIQIGNQSEIQSALIWLSDLSSRAFFFNQSAQAIRIIINKLDGKERLEALESLEHYILSTVDHDFGVKILGTLETSSQEKIHTFFKLLGEYKPSVFVQNILVDILDHDGKLPEGLSKTALQRLYSLELGHNDLSDFQALQKENPNIAFEILNPSIKIEGHRRLSLVISLVHSNLSPELIQLITRALSHASNSVESRFLTSCIEKRTEDLTDVNEDELRKVSKLVISLCKLDSSLIASFNSSSFIRHCTESNSQQSLEHLSLVSKLFSISNKSQLRDSLSYLERVFDEHGAELMSPLLNLMRKYISQDPNIKISKNVFEFVMCHSLDVSKEFLDRMLRLPLLNTRQQDLFSIFFEQKDKLTNAQFQHIAQNLKYFNSVNNLTSARLSEQMKNFDFNSFGPSQVTNIADLALLILLTQSGNQLETNSTNLSTLAKFAKIFGKDEEISLDIIAANEGRSMLEIDHKELGQVSINPDLVDVYKILNDNHLKVSREHMAIMKQLYKKDRTLAPLLLDLVRFGDFASFITVLKESISSESLDAFSLIELTKIFDENLRDLKNWSTAKTAIYGLIAINAPNTVIRSFIKKLPKISENKHNISTLFLETVGQVKIAKMALGADPEDQGLHLYRKIAHDPNYAERSMLANLSDESLYFLMVDSPPSPGYERENLQAESMEIYRMAYDIHHGFGAVTYEFRRTPLRDDPVSLRFARDIGNDYFHINASSRDEYPGRGIRIDGLDLHRMLGFPKEFASENQKSTFEKLLTSYKEALPWLADELDDLPETKYTFLTGLVAITPPQNKKYFLPGNGFKPVHYSLVIYNDHFDSDVSAVAYLVPTSILEAKIEPSTIRGQDFRGFDQNKSDICKASLKISELEAEAKRQGLNILNLGWASNIGGGMCNAYPVESQPFHAWETQVKQHTKDFNGHIHKTHINNTYERNHMKLMKNLDYARLRTAHDAVYKVSRRLSNLISGLQLAQSLRHKGFSYYNESLDQGPIADKIDIDIIDGAGSNEDIINNPYSKYMLQEAYKWHNALHQESRFQERKANRNDFPLLAIAPTFSWSAPVEQEVYFDSYDLSLHLKEGKAPEKIIQFGDRLGEKEEMYWNQYFVKNSLGTDKDIRLVDRSSVLLDV